MTDSVRHMGWDGSPAETCDFITCSARPVLVADLAALDANGHQLDYGAEAHLCAEHLGHLLAQARSILVVNGAVEPTTALERNIVATVKEHLP